MKQTLKCLTYYSYIDISLKVYIRHLQSILKNPFKHLKDTKDYFYETDTIKILENHIIAKRIISNPTIEYSIEVTTRRKRSNEEPRVFYDTFTVSKNSINRTTKSFKETF